jgi:hypothetical protein
VSHNWAKSVRSSRSRLRRTSLIDKASDSSIDCSESTLVSAGLFIKVNNAG